ncbi:DEAD/DEAH box helicase [Jonesia quinghaiensis]|uniref:DEAD/DEAH box helicase n=1 Tax=Jonesia quinghaiensis TaxID=262806 RepID=UPI000490FF58|nr:DEAD/DEAH box helicase [Jonesia quinghaiensis]
MTTRAPLQNILDTIADPSDDDELFDAFSRFTQERGLSLYPAQEEAFLELITGNHVILATPTGSGKSLVAMAAHFVALARGQRSFYTAPLKALVSEKFFALVEVFGSANVGMMTGDSAVNPDAPIICCTAEILANQALRQGGVDEHDPDVDQVVMDEFHFYADPQRGWAWQVPLLELPRVQFLLMSATLGDTSFFQEDLSARTGRDVVEVSGAERPVPLHFSYVIEPLPDVIEELVTTHRSPVYVVHFTQKDAVERAQALLSTKVASKTEKEAIAAELGTFRFGSGFGKLLSKFLRNGIGVHHAGMLPKYRRVVERLTQKGLLKVVCGTDTLGVGINVPIRTVLLTSLVKFDGERMRHLTAREFHQIAGRAGRAGYDTLGEVLVMAPDHVVENRKALIKAGDDPKKIKKIVKKKAPAGSVNWTEGTFERLRDADPEPLTSQFSVTHSMVLNVLARTTEDGRPSDPVASMRHLLTANHDPESRRRDHVRQTFRIYRSLKQAGIVTKTIPVTGVVGHKPTPRIELTTDLPEHFALNQPLSPFALAAQDLLDINSPTHAVDVVSVIESTLDDPRPVLYGQQRAAKGMAIQEMKADGLDYDQRMAELEDITWPRPLADLLEPAFRMYRQSNPWIIEHELSPKSVVREMFETASSFNELISRYQLDRSEGVVLRYLADAYRTLRQTVAAEHRTQDVDVLIEWLGDLVRGVDSSLLDEWERLSNPEAYVESDASDSVLEDDAPPPITANKRVFTAMIRNAMFHRVELAARENYEAFDRLASRDGWNGDQWADALDPMFEEHGDDAIGISAQARSPQLLTITTSTDGNNRLWTVTQTLDDPRQDHDWYIRAQVDLDASDTAGELALRITEVGQK